MRIACLIGLLGLASGACVTTPSRGEPVATASGTGVIECDLRLDKGQGADRDRIRMIRSQDNRVDLDVCGLVRR